MTNKAIFDVDVDTTKFSEFLKLYDRYQSTLKTLPAGWQAVGGRAEEASALWAKVSGQADRQAAAAKMGGRGAEIIAAAAGAVAAGWAAATHSVSIVDNHVTRIVGAMVKLSTITTAIGGLLGAGSLFGIDRLAATVSANRRAALGLGLGYGQYQAIGANFSRLVDPGSLLANVAGARYDVTSPQYTALLAAGVNPRTVRSGNTADVTAELMQRLPQLFAGMNTERDRGLIGAKAHALGIDQLMSMQDLVAFLNASPAERQTIIKRSLRDSKTMDLTDAAQRKWQDLTTQLGRAAAQIETTFAEKLARIEPGLEKLSEAFVKAFKAFADSGLAEKGINALAGGLSSLADYLDSKQFQDDMSYWIGWLSDAGAALWKFIRSFDDKFDGSGGSDSTAYPPPNVQPSAALSSPQAVGQSGARPATLAAMAGLPSAGMTISNELLNQYANTPSGHEAWIRARAAYWGVDPDFAVAVARTEGNNATGWRGGANLPSAVDIVPATGQSISFSDFQLNVRNGLGTIARAAGIDPAKPEDWMRADDFALEYMSEHGLGPWARDQTVESYRSAGRLPTVIMRKNTGNNSNIAAYLATNPFAPVQ